MYSDQDEDYYYIEDTSMFDNHRNNFWIKVIDGSHAGADRIDLSKEHTHVLMELAVDCNQKEFRITKAEVRDIFARKYETVENPDPTWDDILPSTPSASFHRLLCSDELPRSEAGWWYSLGPSQQSAIVIAIVAAVGGVLTAKVKK